MGTELIFHLVGCKTGSSLLLQPGREEGFLEKGKNILINSKETPMMVAIEEQIHETSAGQTKLSKHRYGGKRS